MSFWNQLRHPVPTISPDLDPDVEKVKHLVKVYLEAARYVATCGLYNAEKFEHVQSILAPVGASMSETQKKQTLTMVSQMIPMGGVSPWEQMKAMEHKSLAEAVAAFGDLLRELKGDSNDVLLFMDWTIKEMSEIENLIGKNE